MSRVFPVRFLSTQTVRYCSDYVLNPEYLVEQQKGVPMTPQPNDWQQLAEQASSEMDPDKLLILVSQLNRVLGEREERSRAQQRQGNESTFFPPVI
jgi:hypothetical protein